MTFSDRAIEAAAAKLTDDGVFERDEWYDHPVVKRKRRRALKMARSALSAALAVDGLALVPKEPTAAMLKAGCQALDKSADALMAAHLSGEMHTPARTKMLLRYRAMLTAASDGEVG